MPKTHDQEPESITCPKCKRVSYHPMDIRHNFCGVCGFHHNFEDERQE